MSLFKRKKDKDKKKEQAEKTAKVDSDKKIDKEIKEIKDIHPVKSSKTGPSVAEFDRVKRNKKQEYGKHDHGEAYKNLIRPMMTEKATDLGMYNQYVFEVASNANKIEIKKAVKKLYGVKPIKINIVNMRGKNVRYGRSFGKMKNWKKAVVTLKQGDKIDVYEGV